MSIYLQLLKFRILQIRIAAKIISSIGQYPRGRVLIVALRSRSLSRSLLNLILGYRKRFNTFAEAQVRASRHSPAAHELGENIRFHAALVNGVRESDFPVLFFLAEEAGKLRRVFDLGGNVGNLFYSYQNHLKFSPQLVWMILDLPTTRSSGERLAAERNEKRIVYVDSLASASGVDLFIASGSLHYFESSLPEILSTLTVLPRRVVVNRTPCSSGEDLIAIQDNSSYRVPCLMPCKLHSRNKLTEGMRGLGYLLRGEWPVHERKLRVPLYPDYSGGSYSGFYFEKIQDSGSQ